MQTWSQNYKKKGKLLVNWLISVVWKRGSDLTVGRVNNLLSTLLTI